MIDDLSARVLDNFQNFFLSLLCSSLLYENGRKDLYVLDSLHLLLLTANTEFYVYVPPLVQNDEQKRRSAV